MRKTLSVRPEKSEKAKPFTSSMEGATFFDEDDACAGIGLREQPVRIIKVYPEGSICASLYL